MGVGGLHWGWGAGGGSGGWGSQGVRGWSRGARRGWLGMQFGREGVRCGGGLLWGWGATQGPNPTYGSGEGVGGVVLGEAGGKLGWAHGVRRGGLGQQRPYRPGQACFGFSCEFSQNLVCHGVSCRGSVPEKPQPQTVATGGCVGPQCLHL